MYQRLGTRRARLGGRVPRVAGGLQVAGDGKGANAQPLVGAGQAEDKRDGGDEQRDAGT